MKSKTDQTSRREFFRTFSKSLLFAPLGGAVASSLSCSHTKTRGKKLGSGIPAQTWARISPIDRTKAAIVPAPAIFSGDNPDATHAILWDKEKFIQEKLGGTIPEPTLTAPVVVVGGGVSGLFSAWLLREQQPIVLERADRFGGNARGESWGTIEYAIGAAYYTQFDEGTPERAVLDELGITQAARIKTTEDPVIFKGKRHDRFWEGETDPKHADQFKKLQQYFKDVSEDANGRKFPRIPIVDPADREWIAELDKISFGEHLEQILGQKLRPHMVAALEHYCWSSFDASIWELSAAQGLNFYAGEFGPVCVLPGGNSKAAEMTLEQLAQYIPADNLKTNAIVFDVRVAADQSHARVSYWDGVKAHTIQTQAVVMACPKFAVKRILHEIEPERKAAIERIQYNSYLVANVLLDHPIPDDFYDLFLIGQGITQGKNPQKDSERQKVTDVVLATYAKPHPAESILSLYRGMPYAGARPVLLYDPGAYDRAKKEFKDQILKEILPLVGAKPHHIKDLRITRWGHPLPVAKKGLIADGIPYQLKAPFKKRVFFVEQDNWALPALETGLTEAVMTIPQVNAVIV